jgi:hypothetical protein
VTVAVPRREQHDDAFGVEPPSDEEERVGGRRVQPLDVVHEAQDGLLLRQLGKQAETACGDQETLLGSAAVETESRPERRGLWLRDSADQIERRPE